ncbi:hypothetical protein SO694_00068194 [Aureococcus anophagefferens]|uniref:Uncharacterized protein n=1 Tax=Aureococcus anophagefferens TaxID=44056 RepID=A0ABR1FPV7_AURAN
MPRVELARARRARALAKPPPAVAGAPPRTPEPYVPALVQLGQYIAAGQPTPAALWSWALWDMRYPPHAVALPMANQVLHPEIQAAVVAQARQAFAASYAMMNGGVGPYARAPVAAAPIAIAPAPARRRPRPCSASSSRPRPGRAAPPAAAAAKSTAPWSAAEDEELTRLVTLRGPRRWDTSIALEMPGRNGKQCRERWNNHLDPTVSKEPWTLDEVRTILVEYHKRGNKWAEISRFLPGRTDNAVKNLCNASFGKRFKRFVAEEVDPTLRSEAALASTAVAAASPEGGPESAGAAPAPAFELSGELLEKALAVCVAAWKKGQQRNTGGRGRARGLAAAAASTAAFLAEKTASKTLLAELDQARKERRKRESQDAKAMEEWDRENKALREREYSVFLDRRKKKKEQLRRDRFNSTIAREKEVWAKNDARLKAMPAAAKVRFVRRAVNRPNASGGSPRTAPLREDASSSDEDASSSDEDDDDMDPEDAFGYESEELVSAEVIFGEEDARDAYELARGAGPLVEFCDSLHESCSGESSSVAPPDEDESNDGALSLVGKIVVVSGTSFKGLKKAVVQTRVLKCGGLVRKRLSGLVDYVVFGENRGVDKDRDIRRGRYPKITVISVEDVMAAAECDLETALAAQRREPTATEDIPEFFTTEDETADRCMKGFCDDPLCTRAHQCSSKERGCCHKKHALLPGPADRCFPIEKKHGKLVRMQRCYTCTNVARVDNEKRAAARRLAHQKRVMEAYAFYADKDDLPADDASRETYCETFKDRFLEYHADVDALYRRKWGLPEGAPLPMLAHVFMVSVGSQSLEQEGITSSIRNSSPGIFVQGSGEFEDLCRLFTTRESQAMGPKAVLGFDCEGSRDLGKLMEGPCQQVVLVLADELDLLALFRVIGIGGPMGAPPYQVGIRLTPMRLGADGRPVVPGPPGATFAANLRDLEKFLAKDRRRAASPVDESTAAEPAPVDQT